MDVDSKVEESNVEEAVSKHPIQKTPAPTAPPAVVIPPEFLTRIEAKKIYKRVYSKYIHILKLSNGFIKERLLNNQKEIQTQAENERLKNIKFHDMLATHPPVKFT